MEQGRPQALTDRDCDMVDQDLYDCLVSQKELVGFEQDLEGTARLANFGLQTSQELAQLNGLAKLLLLFRLQQAELRGLLKVSSDDIRKAVLLWLYLGQLPSFFNLPLILQGSPLGGFFPLLGLLKPSFWHLKFPPPPLSHEFRVLGS
jgi:hypothetical protein